jgi:hypothetical protein
MLTVARNYLDVSSNPLLNHIDVSALRTVLSNLNIDNAALNTVNASALPNVTGYVFVNRCTNCVFSSFVQASVTSPFLCSPGRGNVLQQSQKGVVCTPCNPGFYTNMSTNLACSSCPPGYTSGFEANSCFPSSLCALVTVPAYGCVNANVSINAIGSGSWSSPNTSVVVSNRYILKKHRLFSQS